MEGTLFMKKEVICPQCSKARLIGETSKAGASCRTCASVGKNLGKRRTQEEKVAISERQRGEKNPFYGKHHSTKSKLSIGKYIRSEETKQQARENLKKNRRDNKKTNYEIWVERYGIVGANERNDQYRKRQSILNSGENNAMFGKSPPQGSGNGWSGWYRGIFFRSILELSYLVYLNNKKIQFESGELNRHRVQYEVNGKHKSYCCDFYLPETDEHIEIKPRRLINSSENKTKFEAAKKYHKSFRVLTENDFEQITSSELINLYTLGDLIWMKRYETKFKERYLI